MRDLRVFYFCYDHQRSTGGQKQMYRHVDILNSNGYQAFAVHTRKGFHLEWFKEKVKSGEYYFGNLLKEHVYKFWDKRLYRTIRETSSLADKKVCIPECKNCHMTICFSGPNVRNAHIIAKR